MPDTVCFIVSTTPLLTFTPNEFFLQAKIEARQLPSLCFPSTLSILALIFSFHILGQTHDHLRAQTKMAAKPDEHSIDIASQMVNSMVQKVRSLQDSGSWKDGLRTIHRVPLNIRKRDENAYQPKILSIGPYHRGDLKLQAMEVHKMRYLSELLGSNLEANITKCVEKIKELEKEARRCYSETIDLGTEEFVEMMLLDGCFIIQFLIQRNQHEVSKQKRREAGDPIYVVSWMSPLIRHDLLMLENQIPFTILKAIFDVTQSSSGKSLAHGASTQLHHSGRSRLDPCGGPCQVRARAGPCLA